MGPSPSQIPHPEDRARWTFLGCAAGWPTGRIKGLDGNLTPVIPEGPPGLLALGPGYVWGIPGPTFYSYTSWGSAQIVWEPFEMT